MATVVTNNVHYQNIAAAIREKTGDAATYKPEEMASEVATVFEAGKKSEYDAFWDSYQENGNRIDYIYAFSKPGWNDTTFKPKYPICGTNYLNMFWESQVSSIQVPIDFSKTINVNYIFAAMKNVTELPAVDLSNIPGGNIFSIINFCHNLEKASIIGIREDHVPITWTSYDEKLKNLILEGTIGQNGFDTSWSTLLSKDSILSIINALSANTTGLTVTLSLTAVNNAFETSAGAADGATSDEWATLIATKPNWTISLV